MSVHFVHVVAVWLSAVMAFVTALVYFASPKPAVENFASLGYTRYLMYILGFWKFFGAIALVAPVHPIVRE